eukprot:TRINITY_DN6936_c0_g1_i7.p1 TRINITY_DN6936_c0_g1~~TRINITY_DN6936_c0_g1_i7.p1  ORF type:complete len:230 (-),score=74.56 TRINITY_DN6936_c0_g1_i7:107-796(-)
MFYCFIGFFFFFFKQKTAYEMLRSLVGSEMCIRDRSTQSTGSAGPFIMNGRAKMMEATKYHLKIRPNCVVTLRNPHSVDQPFIGKVIGIERDIKTSEVVLKLQWYYHPEESTCGRQTFHGSKELFLSDHRDEQKLDCVEGIIKVHTLEEYGELKTIGLRDYFWRYNYKASTGEFRPKTVPVFCNCEEPYNPDLAMIQCDRCEEWYHLGCVGLSEEELDDSSWTLSLIHI